jgi:hypothetical protein
MREMKSFIIFKGDLLFLKEYKISCTFVEILNSLERWNCKFGINTLIIHSDSDRRNLRFCKD